MNTNRAYLSSIDLTSAQLLNKEDRSSAQLQKTIDEINKRWSNEQLGIW